MQLYFRMALFRLKSKLIWLTNLLLISFNKVVISKKTLKENETINTVFIGNHGGYSEILRCSSKIWLYPGYINTKL